MRLAFVLVIVACASPRPSAVAPAQPCPAAPAAAPTVPPPPDLTEADVKAKSHAFFDAFDRDDVTTFSDLVGPTFVLFETARTYKAEHLATGLKARAERHAPVRSRTWKDERVFTTGPVAVFIGEAIVTFPAEQDRPASTEDGWNTLVWVRDGAQWKVAHFDWQLGGIEAERAMWNNTFQLGVNFNHKPNQTLVDAIKGRKPGTALDVAMGQGRNALYLASQGWKTTGVDPSDEAIKLAKEQAAKDKLKLDTIQTDLDTFDFGKDKWDLVTLIYAGSSEDEIKKIQTSLKKGGLFICEFFQKEATAGTGIGGFEHGRLATVFKDWKIVRNDEVEDIADWGMRKTKLVRFVAQKP